MQNDKYTIFLTIAKQLNQKNIIPLLMGSVGLEVVTGKNWDAKDLDIHVPGDERGWEIPPEQAIYDWDEIMNIMLSLEYSLIDLHEHEFEKESLAVGFGIMDTLPDFAGIPLKDLELHQQGDVKYYLLTSEQYLKVYKASSKDSYRADKNNEKDVDKILYLQRFISQNRKEH
ncbi:phosphoribosylanthranilate isomerase [Oceanobacillus sp. CFH 90083]|uniref:phosphoribosylanthranilate isomerase n=1 Tax=Oceanobacillus sp. CFH 90083 TaxID=2592336 RepID=UPI00128DE3F4|nr:phosphoribosylanthranilate isomerase [Oceanobacillus sp. CFH 90083]